MQPQTENLLEFCQLAITSDLGSSLIKFASEPNAVLNTPAVYSAAYARALRGVLSHFVHDSQEEFWIRNPVQVTKGTFAV